MTKEQNIKITKEQLSEIKKESYLKGYNAGVKKGERNITNGIGYHLKGQAYRESLIN